MDLKRLVRPVVLAALALSAIPSLVAIAAAQGSCTFTLGFKALRDQIPDIVGDCLEDEHFNLANGNAEQRTTGGLLVWRKADNWTAFTNGSTTWINGPEGLASRPNAGPLFPWETPPAPAPVAEPPAPPQPVAPPSPTPTPVVQPAAKPSISDLRFSYDASGADSVPVGGNMPDVTEGTIYAHFSYHNMPPGTTLRVRILWGKETRREFDAPLSRADGTARVVIISFNSTEGGASFPFGDVGIVILLNGEELARGTVGL